MLSICHLFVSTCFLCLIIIRGKITRTVLQLQMDVQTWLQWDKNAWLHNSYFGGRWRIAQPVSSLSSFCIVFCVVVNVMKQTGHQKSGILLVAHFYWRCIFIENFWAIYYHMLCQNNIETFHTFWNILDDSTHASRT
jgi:hypothetical protein